jgi:glycosyltransferase involved in cell wall biosynthesis
VVTARRILYVQYTDPAVYPPLEHSSRLFAERGWEVFMLGTGTASELNLQLPSHPRIRIKKIGFVRPGWRQKIQYIFFFFLALYWTWWWRPSWIYASDPLACPVVWLIQRLVNVRIAYHEHDSPVDGCAQSWFMKSVLAFHKKIGREAAVCVLPQQERLLRFMGVTGRMKPTFCVWNCPRKEEILPAPAVNDNPMILYYHGNISPNLLPGAMLIAVSRFEGKMRLRVAGYETAGNEGYLTELVSPIGEAPELIEPLGSLKRADLFRAASAAHVGLCVMPKSTENINLRHMVGASNKAFDYMACGLPLLVTDLPEWVGAFVEPGYARACNPDDPDSIEAALRWYFDHPGERREMGRKCREKIEQAWNYEAVFADVLAKIENG